MQLALLSVSMLGCTLYPLQLDSICYWNYIQFNCKKIATERRNRWKCPRKYTVYTLVYPLQTHSHLLLFYSSPNYTFWCSFDAVYLEWKANFKQARNVISMLEKTAHERPDTRTSQSNGQSSSLKLHSAHDWSRHCCTIKQAVAEPLKGS